jgi:hypothetical protein
VNVHEMCHSVPPERLKNREMKTRRLSTEKRRGKVRYVRPSPH